VRIRDFLQLIYEAVAAQLPESLRDHEWRIRWSLLQVYFERSDVHYEVWIQKKARRIELGLHFECERDESYRWAAILAPRVLEIQSQLGPEIEIEEWTASWTRLHELRTFTGDLTPSLAEETARRLAQFITTLEPIVAEERAAVA
jgi:hypothetical protein